MRGLSYITARDLTCLTVAAAESGWTRAGVSTGAASSWVAVASTATWYCQTNRHKSLGNHFTYNTDNVPYLYRINEV